MEEWDSDRGVDRIGDGGGPSGDRVEVRIQSRRIDGARGCAAPGVGIRAVSADDGILGTRDAGFVWGIDRGGAVFCGDGDGGGGGVDGVDGERDCEGTVAREKDCPRRRGERKGGEWEMGDGGGSDGRGAVLLGGRGAVAVHRV